MKKLLLLVALVGGLSFAASQSAEAGYGYGGFGGGYRSAGYGVGYQNFNYRPAWSGYRSSYGLGYGFQGNCYHGHCDYNNYVPSYPVYGGCGY